MAKSSSDDASLESSAAYQSSAIFDPEFLEKVTLCKMQFPDMLVSDFFTDDSGIQPMPDIENDINAKMLWAAEHGNLALVKELYSRDRNLLYVRDNDLYTPLHRACYNNHANVVEFLIEHGAEVDAKTEDGWQPLHSAARWGAVDAAQLLLQNGKANVNALTNGNLTPLHLAVSSKEPHAADTARLLLSQPSIVLDVRDNAGDTPSDVARQTSAEMMRLFSDSKIEAARVDEGSTPQDLSENET